MEWPEPWSRLPACGWTTARLETLDDLLRRGLREILEKAWSREATEEELEEFREGPGAREHGQDPVEGGRPVWRAGLGGGQLQVGQDLPAWSGGGGRGSRGAPAGRAKRPWHGLAGWWE